MTERERLPDRRNSESAFAARRAALATACARVDAYRANALRDDAARLVEALAAVVADAHARLVEILAVREAMLNHADQCHDRREPERDAAWRGAASTIQIKPQALVIQPDPVRLAARVAEVRRKIEGG
jgi:hypothetical protein